MKGTREIIIYLNPSISSVLSKACAMGIYAYHNKVYVNINISNSLFPSVRYSTRPQCSLCLGRVAVER